MEKLSDIGIIGLAVMGENLALNMESKGFRVSVFNRTVPGVEEGVVDRFINGRGKNGKFIGTSDLGSFVKTIRVPRKIMIMVKAGKPVDEIIGQLLPLMDKGDVIIDGGNSHFLDTIRRVKEVEKQGMLFVGTGISGGEEGALLGPSIMPGGSSGAWRLVKPILQSIAAKLEDNRPCCDWVGEDGAGHFVKMVHNGIEYGDMQLISEAYHIMRDLLSMSADRMSDVFREWNEGELKSYLIEITADILATKDDEGVPLLDKILDTAGQKGTGKWAAITAMEIGVPLTLTGEAVFARSLSALKEERVEASKILKGPILLFSGNLSEFISDLRDAVYASKIISYAQGYTLIKMAAKEYNWSLNYGGIALMWRGGCIIRSVFLDKIREAYEKNPTITNLLLDPFFKGKMDKAQKGLRNIVAIAASNGIPIPAISSALSYYDAYRSEKLPANLLQAQRDYFGAHTYERTDKPRGLFFHTNWTGKGGSTPSTIYEV